jgi:hypothetical protein
MKVFALGLAAAVTSASPVALAQTATDAPAASAQDSRPPADTRPIRARRPFALAGEVGWNGLAGLGANFSYHPLPQLALDAGAGLGLAGWKGGLRVRANLLTSAWSPVIGAGFLYQSGSAGEAVELQSEGDSAKLEVLGSSYAQLVAGVNYTGDEGFVFMATIGYAFLFGENTRFVSGSRAVYDDVRPLLGSGLVLSTSLGYAF